MAEPAARCRLLELPNELLQHCLTFLNPVDVTVSAAACRTLRTIAYDDCIWQPLVNHQLPSPITSPRPLKTFRDLYVAHHPYWFLPRCRVWFADNEPSGRLLLARYDPATGCIEAFQVTATRGPHSLELWEKNNDVIIHNFTPALGLNLQNPTVRMTVNRQLQDDQPDNLPADRGYAPSSRYHKEALMDVFLEPGLYTSLALCRPLPSDAIREKTDVWPPLRFPAESRVRNKSGDGYNSTGHRPTRLSEVSQNAFRLRKWVEFSGRRSAPNMLSNIASSLNGLGGLTGMGFNGPFFHMDMPSTSHRGHGIRMPEDIATYATLPESCYTPTKEKPWQGIWCGDYSGHGCEFLLITQPDNPLPLPDGMSWLRHWLRTGRRNSISSDSSFSSAHEELPSEAQGLEMQLLMQQQHDQWTNLQNMASPAVGDAQSPQELFTDVPNAPSGRLEAIKLTGDPNVPRGEYTFIAPDIGTEGFLRVADEPSFSGARIVRSAGHIAGRGFREDQYTPSQLIMVSHDRLAQLWMGFGHISYYQRVDIDALLRMQPET